MGCSACAQARAQGVQAAKSLFSAGGKAAALDFQGAAQALAQSNSAAGKMARLVGHKLSGGKIVTPARPFQRTPR